LKLEGVYKEFEELYNIEDTDFNLTIKRATYKIDDQVYNGYSLITPQGKKVFIYRTSSKYHENGTKWGNPWNVFSIIDNKHLIIGRRTKKQCIEEMRRF
jgi:hypothetical protein